MVDKAIYAEKAAREAATARKLAPLGWLGLAANLVALALVANRFVINIAEVGEKSDSFIATTVTAFVLFIALAMLIGWVRWLRRHGTADGLSVLWISTIVLLIVSFSPLLTSDFYDVTPL